MLKLLKCMHCEIQKCKQQLVHLNCDVLNLDKIAALDNICEMDFILIFNFLALFVTKIFE